MHGFCLVILLLIWPPIPRQPHGQKLLPQVQQFCSILVCRKAKWTEKKGQRMHDDCLFMKIQDCHMTLLLIFHWSKLSDVATFCLKGGRAM